MPVTNGRHVFWRMIKTGSSATFNSLGKQKWSVWGAGHDPSFTMFEAQSVSLLGGKRVNGWEVPHHFGGIRRPEDWYGSLWNHTRKRGRRFPEEEFRNFLFRATHPDESMSRPLVVIDAVPGKPKPSRVGLWSWAVDYFYRLDGRWLVDDLVPTDRLEEGVFSLVSGLGGIPMSNTSHRRFGGSGSVEGITDYRSWYDDEMLSWVLEADKGMRDVFGFEPFISSPKAAFHFEGAQEARLAVGSF